MDARPIGIFDSGMGGVSLYNGSGLTDQKDYWTKGINFSAKMQAMLPVGLNVVLSAQKIKPEATGIMMYDAGLNFHRRGWVVEAEYPLLSGDYRLE